MIRNFALILNIRLKYYLNKKYEKLYNFIEINFKLNLFSNLFPCLILSLLMFIVSITIYSSFTIWFSDKFSDYIKEIFFVYSLFLLVNVVINSFKLSQKLILPSNKDYMQLFPYKSKTLFLIDWGIEFIISYLSSFIKILLFGALVFGRYKGMFEINIYFLIFCIVISALAVSFILPNYMCYVTYRNFIKGFYLNSFVLTLIKSSTVFLVSLPVFNVLLSVLENIKIKDRAPNINIELVINSIFKSFSTILEHIKFLQINQIILVTALLLVICIIFYHCISGVWLRTEWHRCNPNKMDWLDILNKFFSKSSKNILMKLQWKNFFNNRVQLQQNYSHFYLHPFNFIHVALAVSLKNLGISNLIPLYIGLYIIFNSCAADSFGSVDLYPGLMRFDSIGNTIVLYRLTGSHFSDHYYRLINQQRILGLPEYFIMMFIHFSIIKPSIPIIMFALSLGIFNFAITPHLNTISSFIFPHFNYQHFSDIDQFFEDGFMRDKIGYKFRQIISLISFFTMIFMIILDFSLDYILFTESIVYLATTAISLPIIKGIVLKKEEKYATKDI